MSRIADSDDRLMGDQSLRLPRSMDYGSHSAKMADLPKPRVSWLVICLEWLLNNRWRVALTLGISDPVTAFAGFILGFILSKKYLGVGDPLDEYWYLWLCFTIFFLLILFLKNGYRQLRSRRPEKELEIIVVSGIYALLLTLTISYVLHKEVSYSRCVVLIGFFIALFLIILCRFTFRMLLRLCWNYGFGRENVIIMGDRFRDINQLLNHLHIQRYTGLRILGYLASAPSEALTGKLQYLGKFEDLTEISRGTVVDRVFLAMRGYSDQRHHTLLSRLEKCAQLKIPVLIISHVFNDFNFSLTLDGYSGIFAVDRRIPIYSKLHNRMLKRAMDIVVSLLLILISFPVWLVIILFIKLFDHGPIFYRSPRVGKGGGQFVALKFRTMMANADEILKNNLELQEKYRKNIKIDYDPRITTVGKWLRKFSLDEIPQIINVLKGDMSLVGPRPALLDEVDLIGDFIHMRNLIRPGLTGFWQVSGRNKTTYEERIQMDKFYINNWSIWMDLVILLKTPIIVLFGHGAM